ncbi:hypothetical protein FA15DRAFT_705281 [Coprinopsis marcescibilis]|uniref:Uncharacterized protein n=1 Tax=Coprinopsis marcescibilis TaxID=230819 RepID=A0A5C3KT24_COPMA|nr:hypothetical protein FA15DRAFT_705281 [Coprinopsis marcescibilis]
MPMDPVYRVCMAKEYNVSAWLLLGYEGIATRTVPLNTGEASRIGWESALMISSVIIRRLRAPTPEPEEPGVPAVSGPSNLGLANDIMYEFATEFEAMKKAEGVYLTKKERLEKEIMNEGECGWANTGGKRRKKKRGMEQRISAELESGLGEEVVVVEVEVDEAANPEKLPVV